MGHKSSPIGELFCLSVLVSVDQDRLYRFKVNEGKRAKMFNLVNLEEVRNEMVSEIQADIESDSLYKSPRLTQQGIDKFTVALLEAAKSKTPEQFAKSIGREDFKGYDSVRPKGYGKQRHKQLNSRERQPRPHGKGMRQQRIPKNAGQLLCQSEFNKYYMRAVCVKAISQGQAFVTVYRARPLRKPTLSSTAAIGKSINALELLECLRTGANTKSLGLPSHPNSGISVKL